MAVCDATVSTAIPVVLVPNTVPTSVVVLAKDFGPHLVCSFLNCAKRHPLAAPTNVQKCVCVLMCNGLCVALVRFC